MGKAVGGGVYSVGQAVQQANAGGGKPPITPSRVKVDLESIEFTGDLNDADWANLKNDLKALEQKYNSKIKVKIQSRPSKP